MPSVLGDIVGAVASGLARRPALDELIGYEYFVDAEGRVYSMNNEEPRIVEAKTGWGGLDWVVLMTRDGWKKYFVGELVAEAFMRDQRPGEDYTVVNIDGNGSNNCPSNLRWVTQLEASRHRQHGSRSRPTPRAKVAARTGRILSEASNPEAADAGCVEHTPARGEDGAREALKLIERNQRTQERLEELAREHQMLMGALTPFAAFAASPELRVAHPDKVVMETNKGRPSHMRLTAGDFRRAFDVIKDLERGPA